ncbi:MAG TPA: AI-2E family transporter [Chryseolinea sp.]|jgi:predicted PurR-regulated permease PerM|nr:AI-2E family transporter [Chryseolinea sp.]
MEPNNLQNPPSYTFEKLVDTIIRLALLFLLLGWCFTILRPFILILIWAGVIAIALYPLYIIFLKMFRQRKAWASVVLTLLMLSILIIPSWLLTQSVFEEVSHLRDLNQEGKLVIPPPGENTESWPAIAKPILDFWRLASENLQEAMMQYSDKLKAAGSWLLSAIAGIGKGILQFIASIIIAGVLLAYSTSVANAAIKIFTKLVGKNGENFANTTVITVRSVVKGILGVAVIQATMAGLGFFIAGVPYAGVWTVACLFFAVIQVGAGPVAIPVMIYMFSATDTLTAVLLAIWLVITLISDNILKPLLLGRGAPAPMLVVFLGAIGGFITSGFLGLFLGAVILTLGYKLFMVWLESSPIETSVK